MEKSLSVSDPAIYAAADLIEDDGIDCDTIQESVAHMLSAFGENPERDGLQRTPERVARMYEELLEGYRTDPVALVNDALFTVEYDEMVIVRDIEFYSLCEHHLLPFLGRAHVAYMPSTRVIGLSKDSPDCRYVCPPVAGSGTYDHPDCEFPGRGAAS